MKITVLYGSARKNGSSATTAKKILEKVRCEKDEVKEYWLTDKNIQPCIGCLACRKKEVCSRKNDDMPVIYQDIVSSDFVIFSSPLYCLDVAGSFKMMFDRLYPMVDGPQGIYTPRHPGIKCCMVYSQGAPGLVFRNAAKLMKIRLKTNGFHNLGIIRETLTVDLTNATDNKFLLKFADFYRNRQRKKNQRMIEKICRQIR